MFCCRVAPFIAIKWSDCICWNRCFISVDKHLFKRKKSCLLCLWNIYLRGNQMSHSVFFCYFCPYGKGSWLFKSVGWLCSLFMGSISKISFNFYRLGFALDMHFSGMGSCLWNAIDNKKVVLVLMFLTEWSFIFKFLSIEKCKIDVSSIIYKSNGVAFSVSINVWIADISYIIVIKICLTWIVAVRAVILRIFDAITVIVWVEFTLGMKMIYLIEHL